MWATKYRPLTFADVLGQAGTAAVLKERLRKKTAFDRSYIFVGGAGCGKTTIARILAKALLCERLDLKDPEPCNQCDACLAILNETSLAFSEQDAASQGSIDNIRKIVDDLPFGVMGAEKKIYTLDEAHRLSAGAQDVLLKPIEEGRLVAMFCTTEPEKIRGTIRSRCEEYQIRKVSREDILGRMKHILTQEGFTGEDDAILAIIDCCGGHVRDVISKMEMIAQSGQVDMEGVRSYLNLSVVSSYYEILLLLPTDVSQALALAEKACLRVTPEEVMSGLAEAAMNSWRLANKMYTDFVWIDRQLAGKVHAQYTDGCVGLAEYFSRSKYTTQIGLFCDLVALGRTKGAGVPQVRVEAPQIVVNVASAPTPEAVVAVIAPEIIPAITSVVPQAVPIPNPPPNPQFVAPQVVPPATASPAAPGPPGPIPFQSGHWSGGEADLHGIPRQLPERKTPNFQRPPPPFESKNSDETAIITPDEWQAEFQKRWKRES